MKVVFRGPCLKRGSSCFPKSILKKNGAEKKDKNGKVYLNRQKWAFVRRVLDDCLMWQGSRVLGRPVACALLYREFPVGK